jgi:long-chain acyl-CoA synthetase
MSRVIAALRHHAARTPLQAAVVAESGTLAYGELLVEVDLLAQRLRESSARAIGILADNCPAWVITDLAAQLVGIPVIPLPPFFSSAQIVHAVRSAGIDRVMTDQPDRLGSMFGEDCLSTTAFCLELVDVRLRVDSCAAAGLPAGTQKVTFTSGTTGEPKGVRLGVEELETTAESLRIASGATGNDRHLCVLPLATLLENIGGVYTPLLAGATICVPSLTSVGMSGSSGLDIGHLIAALGKWQASSAIMVPQMLQAVVAAGNVGVRLPRALRYLAVGGAPIALRLLHEAHALGMPVYEGYGLSECASVVAVNSPGASRVGSVGKPLPHVQIGFSTDGEILVRGIRWRGHVGDPANPHTDDAIATGDLGYMDADGFLHLTGRKKNIFITSFGRNVAPEWIERELVSRHPILQAAVFGEARPFNTAVIVTHPAATRQCVARALDDANQQLPDYARIATWIPAQEPFTAGNGMSTPNGRLKRTAIFGAYADRINALYQL